MLQRLFIIEVILHFKEQKCYPNIDRVLWQLFDGKETTRVEVMGRQTLHFALHPRISWLSRKSLFNDLEKAGREQQFGLFRAQSLNRCPHSLESQRTLLETGRGMK